MTPEMLAKLRATGRDLEAVSVALAETHPREVFDFLDAVERDVGPETCRRLEAMRDRQLRAEMEDVEARRQRETL